MILIGLKSLSSGAYDDYNTLRNTISHEADLVFGHRGEKSGATRTFESHANVYYGQSLTCDFAESTPSNKHTIAKGFAERIYTAVMNSELDRTQEKEYIDNYNKANSGNVYIDYSNLNGNASVQISVDGKKYERVELTKVDKPNH